MKTKEESFEEWQLQFERNQIYTVEDAWSAAWDIQQENVDHLKDLSYELEQNLLCAEDQNHYFKLMGEYRDRMYDTEKKMEEMRKVIDELTDVDPLDVQSFVLKRYQDIRNKFNLDKV